ncbi:MAG: DUF1566 domain-containing protein [Chlorobiaceae bacterium]|jgi:hypothetical protein|nr:DUF1566 domain-containing protein [Chlorobiaceae bacterium]NTV16387.1 DUF1566 domain-containing protein [Chlorobiaceae bacterium]
MTLLNKVFGRKESAAPDIKIGVQYGGGIIFYTDQTGQHGLIAAKSDMPGCSAAIAALQGLSEGLFNWEDAVKSCKKSESNGYSDWLLPNKEQLNLLYLRKGAVGGFTHASAIYWSSSKSTDGYAWIKDFSSFGCQNSENKESYNRVRAIRVF